MHVVQINESEPLTVENLRLVSTMTREPSESGFHTIPCAMQARVGPLVCRLFLLDVAVQSRSTATVLKLLKDLTAVLKDFQTIFARVIRVVDVDVFYNIYRCLLGGYYPNGVVFRGVPATATARESAPNEDVCVHDFVSFGKGPSAGQSAMIILFDLALGITHGPESGAFQVSGNSSICSCIIRAHVS